MNRVTEILTNSLEPKMAIIVYSDGSEYFLERRDIKKGRMNEGMPLTEKCLSDMSEVLTSATRTVVHGKIPSIMIFADSRPGHEKYIWYRKPEKRKLYFSEKLNIKNGWMMLPGLVYMVKGKDLSVYAVKTKSRVWMNTRLYNAPFFNIYDTANVCLGNAKVRFPDELTYEGIINHWEAKFWLSNFDHLLGSNPVKGNLSIITRKCIKTGCDFPTEVLLPIQKTKLKDLL